MARVFDGFLRGVKDGGARPPRARWSWGALLFSAALLTPCFWQSRIQAADFSSHIYNAWLAAQIHQGKAPGLWIAPQTNNVLFDWMLEALYVRFGSDAAQRIAVSLCVLTFGWGAISFLFRVAGGRNWWFAGPCVAMLAYGLNFQMGFFNFYLSMGLCLWYLALFWTGSWRKRALCIPLLLIAWLAHPFPVLWAAGSASYIACARNLQTRRRALLLAAGLAFLVATHFVLTHRYSYSWSAGQALLVSGTNQIRLFGPKYMLPHAMLLLVWLVLLRRLSKRAGWKELAASLPFQLWVLNAAAVVLIPDNIMFPQYALPFGFVAERLSLGSALTLSAVLVAVPVSNLDKCVLSCVVALFFTFLYLDDRSLNRMEDGIERQIAQLPAGQRVISPPRDFSLKSFCFHHDVDRACIGHCLSYANYEASTRQFRIRAGQGNGMVMDEYKDVAAVENGTYRVKPGDLPVYMVYECGSGQVCSRPLGAGERAAGAN